MDYGFVCSNILRIRYDRLEILAKKRFEILRIRNSDTPLNTLNLFLARSPDLLYNKCAIHCYKSIIHLNNPQPVIKNPQSITKNPYSIITNP